MLKRKNMYGVGAMAPKGSGFNLSRELKHDKPREPHEPREDRAGGQSGPNRSYGVPPINTGGRIPDNRWIPSNSTLNNVQRDYNTITSSITDKHPMSSSVIDRHPMSSSAIDRHPMSSSVIDKHPISSPVIDRHPISSSIIDKHPQSSSVIDNIRNEGRWVPPVATDIRYRDTTYDSRILPTTTDRQSSTLYKQNNNDLVPPLRNDRPVYDDRRAAPSSASERRYHGRQGKLSTSERSYDERHARPSTNNIDVLQFKKKEDLRNETSQKIADQRKEDPRNDTSQNRLGQRKEDHRNDTSQNRPGQRKEDTRNETSQNRPGQRKEDPRNDTSQNRPGQRKEDTRNETSQNRLGEKLFNNDKGEGNVNSHGSCDKQVSPVIGKSTTTPNKPSLMGLPGKSTTTTNKPSLMGLPGKSTTTPNKPSLMGLPGKSTIPSLMGPPGKSTTTPTKPSLMGILDEEEPPPIKRTPDVTDENTEKDGGDSDSGDTSDSSVIVISDFDESDVVNTPAGQYSKRSIVARKTKADKAGGKRLDSKVLPKGENFQSFKNSLELHCTLQNWIAPMYRIQREGFKQRAEVLCGGEWLIARKTYVTSRVAEVRAAYDALYAFGYLTGVDFVYANSKPKTKAKKKRKEQEMGTQTELHLACADNVTVSKSMMKRIKKKERRKRARERDSGNEEGEVPGKNINIGVGRFLQGSSPTPTQVARAVVEADNSTQTPMETQTATKVETPTKEEPNTEETDAAKGRKEFRFYNLPVLGSMSPPPLSKAEKREEKKIGGNKKSGGSRLSSGLKKSNARLIDRGLQNGNLKSTIPTQGKPIVSRSLIGILADENNDEIYSEPIVDTSTAKVKEVDSKSEFEISNIQIRQARKKRHDAMLKMKADKGEKEKKQVPGGNINIGVARMFQGTGMDEPNESSTEDRKDIIEISDGAASSENKESEEDVKKELKEVKNETEQKDEKSDDKFEACAPPTWISMWL